jgi:hypothetical protein
VKTKIDMIKPEWYKPDGIGQDRYITGLDEFPAPVKSSAAGAFFVPVAQTRDARALYEKRGHLETRVRRKMS